jgi:hypothetical protein
MRGKLLLLAVFLFSFNTDEQFYSVYNCVPTFERKYSMKWNQRGCFQSTEDMNNRKITCLDIGFSTKKAYTIDELRVIFVNLIETFLKDINSETKYVDTYKSFPLTLHNINATIMYLGYDYYNLPPDKGFTVTLKRDKILYYRENFKINTQETLEEALEKLHKTSEN